MSGLRDAIASHAPLALAMGGGLIGFVFGAVVQRTGFCAMGAVSDWHTFGDTRRLRAWVLAAALALIGTQALAGFGLVAIDKSMYVAPSFNWLGNLLGGAMFGFGMVLAGGCASRNLVRAGTGDLRAGLNLVVVGIFAFMAIGGVFGPARAAMETATAVDLAKHGASDQSLSSLLVATGMLTEARSPLAATLLVAVPVLAWCFALAAFRKSGRHVASAIGVAACVIAGWALTGLAFDELATRPMPPVSLTYVRPAGDALDWLQRFTALGLPGFGVASVFGAAIGGWLAAAISGRPRLQTFAGTGDTLRNLAGAALMGVGGVMALGCTIGQAVTGVSTLAAGSFLAFAAMIAGARTALVALEKWS